ncbi:MAG: hypothetical protein R6V06_05540 [Kiritimatiellia bacterium]
MKAVVRNILFILSAGLLSAFDLYAAWHLQDAPCRRKLKVEGDGELPVCVTTTVFMDDRFKGFSLFDAKDKPRSFYLLNRMGSQVSIYFNGVSGESLFLYPSSRQELPGPGGPFPITGLRQETRSYDGCEVKSSAQFNELWKEATFQGAGFADRVYSSYNPFGPNAGALHRYDGTLVIDKPGNTVFCTASTDASFLLINDKEVASWPGKHDVREGLDGSKRGSLNLKAGLCRFTYLHANSGKTSYAIAAMVAPGDKEHYVFSPDMFTQAAYAYVGPLVKRDGQKQADFIWENSYMVTIRDHALHEMVFEATDMGDKNAVYEWEFGDGVRRKGKKVKHLVFRRGDFPVKLRISGGGKRTICSQVVNVVPRYGQSERDDKRAIALIEQAVKQEKELDIQPEGYALISRGWFFFMREPDAAAFAPRVLAAVERISEDDLNEVLIELALGVQQVDEQYELAEKCFKMILEKVKKPEARAFAALHYSGMLNLCLNRPEKAREIQNSIKRSDLGTGDQRLLDIYLADTALVLDDFATAEKMYRAVARYKSPVADGELKRDVVFDSNSRFFRLQNLLSQQLYRESLQVVDMIEWDMPEERASSRMNLLKVRALVGNNQPKKAVVCLQRALLAEVDDTYTPKLRLELARLYVNMNRFAQAQHQINILRQESPWSREELEARKLAKSMEKKMREM